MIFQHISILSYVNFHLICEKIYHNQHQFVGITARHQTQLHHETCTWLHFYFVYLVDLSLFFLSSCARLLLATSCLTWCARLWPDLKRFTEKKKKKPTPSNRNRKKKCYTQQQANPSKLNSGVSMNQKVATKIGP